MALREIRTFDDPVLRKKSRSVQKVDDKIRELLKDMADTMYHTPNGGGLAACQVGILKRLVVIDLGDGLLQLVDPEITEAQGKQTVTEGCLSFPNVWARLRRPARVTAVSYTHLDVYKRQGATTPFAAKTLNDAATKAAVSPIADIVFFVFL